MSILFLASLAGLGAVDALLVEGIPAPHIAQEPAPQPPQTIVTREDGSGIAKISGPDMPTTIAQLGLTAQETQELSILRSVVPKQEATVQTQVLLKNGDRAGLIAWTESANVKGYYLALKEALHTSFSPQVQDLLDETQRQPDRPPRNFLTFLDPGISSERLVFVRVRERLYELHVAPGHEDELFVLIEALTM